MVRPLSALSSDELSFITRYLNSYAIGKLWFCGDSVLHFKLKNGGVTRIELEINALSAETYRIPPLVFYFSELRHLVALPNVLVPRFPLAASSWSLIPSKVNSIVLHSLDISGLYDNAPHIWAQLATLFVLNPIYETPFYMKRLPSTLESIKFATKLEPIDARSLLASLPHTLLHLHLPPLKGASSTTKTFDLSPFKEIQTLDIHDFHGIDKTSILQLRQLQKLSIPVGHGCSIDWTPEMLLQLPRNLVYLDAYIPDFMLPHFHALPPGLRFLHIGSASKSSSKGTMPLMTPEMIKALPRNLTEFVNNANYSIRYQDCYHLPNTLTHLRVKFLEPWNPGSVQEHSLPNSILLFEIRSGDLDLNHAILPSNLKSLVLRNLVPSTAQDLGLPPSLTKLLVQSQFFEQAFDAQPNDLDESARETSTTTTTKLIKLPEQGVPSRTLPESLNDLIIHVSSSLPLPLKFTKLRRLTIRFVTSSAHLVRFGRGWSRHLPATLEYLWLSIFTHHLDKTWVDHLDAPLLEDFTLEIATSMRVHKPMLPSFEVAHFLERLPAMRLRNFSFSGPYMIPFDRFWLTHMTSVRNLQLYGYKMKKYPKNLLDRLPPHIRTLKLKSPALPKETSLTGVAAWVADSPSEFYVYAGTDDDYIQNWDEGEFQHACSLRHIELQLHQDDGQ